MAHTCSLLLVWNFALGKNQTKKAVMVPRPQTSRWSSDVFTLVELLLAVIEERGESRAVGIFRVIVPVFYSLPGITYLCTRDVSNPESVDSRHPTYKCDMRRAYMFQREWRRNYGSNVLSAVSAYLS